MSWPRPKACRHPATSPSSALAASPARPSGARSCRPSPPSRITRPRDRRARCRCASSGPTPARTRPTPVLLYIHGGGWAQGSVRQNEPAIHALASGSGWCVAALSYRLAPEHPYPAGLEDCLAVAAWLRAAGAALGLDPARIALGGASAGANLAMAAGLAPPRPRRGRLGPSPLLRHLWPRPRHAVLPGVRRRQLRPLPRLDGAVFRLVRPDRPSRQRSADLAAPGRPPRPAAQLPRRRRARRAAGRHAPAARAPPGGGRPCRASSGAGPRPWLHQPRQRGCRPPAGRSPLPAPFLERG